VRALLEAETLEFSSEIEAAERRELALERDRAALAAGRHGLAGAAGNASHRITP